MPVQRFEGTVEVVDSLNARVGISKIILLDGNHCRIVLDGDISAGGVQLKSGVGNTAIERGTGGQIELWNPDGRRTVWLNGQGGNCQIGGNGYEGVITLTDGVGQNTVSLRANGLVRLTPRGGNTTIALSGDEGKIEAQILNVTDGQGNSPIKLNGHTGKIEASLYQTTDGDATIGATMGGHRVRGGFVDLYHPNGGIQLSANGSIQDDLRGGVITVMDNGGEPTIQLKGHLGTIEAKDVLLTQADCAEDFDIVAGETAEPGSVMVIDHEGALRESDCPYDRAVAGVISGAGVYKPGIILDRPSAHPVEGRRPIALNGKVYCKVDADYGSVFVGDLLVTSPTRAHAMKATDATKAFGAVIGKALCGLEGGRGLIPILVCLQ